MTAKATFRKVDVERAVEAVKAAGLDVVSVEVRRDGTIRVVTAGGAHLTELTEDERLDRELEEHRRGHGHGAA